jgi:hypothetical protein
MREMSANFLKISQEKILATILKNVDEKCG